MPDSLEATLTGTRKRIKKLWGETFGPDLSKLTTQRDFTAAEAKQYGWYEKDLPEGTIVRVTPDRTAKKKYRRTVIFPDKWEQRDDDIFVDPTGKAFTLQEMEVKWAKQKATQAAFGGVFPGVDIGKIEAYRTEYPEAFASILRGEGLTPKTEALLKEYGLTPERIQEFYAPPQRDETYDAAVKALELYKLPEGGYDVSAAIKAGVPKEYLETAFGADYVTKTFADIEEREAVVRKVFDERDVASVRAYATDYFDIFQQDLREKGRNDDTVALLNQMFPDITDDQINQIFQVEPPPLKPEDIPPEGMMGKLAGVDVKVMPDMTVWEGDILKGTYDPTTKQVTPPKPDEVEPGIGPEGIKTMMTDGTPVIIHTDYSVWEDMKEGKRIGTVDPKTGNITQEKPTTENIRGFFQKLGDFLATTYPAGRFAKAWPDTKLGQANYVAQNTGLSLQDGFNALRGFELKPSVSWIGGTAIGPAGPLAEGELAKQREKRHADALALLELLPKSADSVATYQRWKNMHFYDATPDEQVMLEGIFDAIKTKLILPLEPPTGPVGGVVIGPAPRFTPPWGEGKPATIPETIAGLWDAATAKRVQEVGWWKALWESAEDPQGAVAAMIWAPILQPLRIVAGVPGAVVKGAPSLGAIAKAALRTIPEGAMAIPPTLKAQAQVIWGAIKNIPGAVPKILEAIPQPGFTVKKIVGEIPEGSKVITDLRGNKAIISPASIPDNVHIRTWKETFPTIEKAQQYAVDHRDMFGFPTVLRITGTKAKGYNLTSYREYVPRGVSTAELPAPMPTVAETAKEAYIRAEMRRMGRVRVGEKAQQLKFTPEGKLEVIDVETKLKKEFLPEEWQPRLPMGAGEDLYVPTGISKAEEIALNQAIKRGDQKTIRRLMRKGQGKILEERAPYQANGIYEVAIDKLSTNPLHQPRKGLDAENINRLVEGYDPARFLPIEVKEIAPGAFEVIHGHHRLAVAQKLGLTKVPVRVLNVSSREAIRIAEEANLAGKTLTPTEIAMIVDRRFRLGEEPVAIAKALPGSGLRPNQVENFSRIVNLPTVAREALDDVVLGKHFTSAHAIELARAQVKYSMPIDEVAAFFNEVIMKGDLTPTQLRRVLDNFAPVIREAMAKQAGLFGAADFSVTYTGIMATIREATANIKDLERIQKRLSSIVNLIKEGREIPPELATARPALERQVLALKGRITQTQREITGQISKPLAKPVIPARAEAAIPAKGGIAAPERVIPGITSEKQLPKRIIQFAEPDGTRYEVSVLTSERVEVNTIPKRYATLEVEGIPRATVGMTYKSLDEALASIPKTAKKVDEFIPKMEVALPKAEAAIPGIAKPLEAAVPTPEEAAKIAEMTTPENLAKMQKTADEMGVKWVQDKVDELAATAKARQAEGVVPPGKPVPVTEPLIGGLPPPPAASPPPGSSPPFTPPPAGGIPPVPVVTPAGRLWLPEPPRTAAAFIPFIRKEISTFGISPFRGKTGALDTVEQAHQVVLKARDMGGNTVPYVQSYIRQVGDVTKEFGLTAEGLATKVVNPQKRSLAINDILSNYTHYDLTPKQLELAKRQGFVYREALKLARSYGVDIKELEGPDELWQYIARRVKGKKDPVSGLYEMPPPTIGGFKMGAKISAQKERVFEEMMQGVDLDFLYENPNEVLGYYIQGIYRLIGNKQAQNLVEPLTRAITKEAPLIFGERGIAQPAMRTRAAAVEVANAIDKIFVPEVRNKALGLLADVSGAVVGQVAAVDASVHFIQALPILGMDIRNAIIGKPSVQWVKGWGIWWKSVLNPEWIHTFRPNNPALYKRGIEVGLMTGQSEFVAGVPLAGRALGKIPKIGKTLQEWYRQIWGRMGQAYSDVLEYHKLKLLGMMDEKWVAAGGDPYDLGTMLNRMAGGVSAKARGVNIVQRDVERIAGFAPNYFRSSLLLLKDMFTGGMKAKEVASTLAALLGFGAAVYYAEEKIRGKKPKIKPWPKKYGGDGAEAFTTEIAGQRVGVGTWMYGMIKMLAEVGAIAIDEPESLIVFNDRHPIGKFLKSKRGPFIGVMQTLTTGKTYFGTKLEGPVDYLAEVLKQVVVPIMGQSLIEKKELGIPKTGEEIGATLGAEFLGLRTFPYMLRSRWIDEGHFEAFNAIPSDKKEVKKAQWKDTTFRTREQYRTDNPDVDAKLFITGEVTSLLSEKAENEVDRLIKEHNIDLSTIKGIRKRIKDLE